MNQRGKLGFLLGLAGSVGLFGCAIGVDLINPGLIEGFGLDQNLVNPPQGVVVVVLDNQTSAQATMCVAVLPSAAASSVQSACHDVPAGQTRNYVWNCPIQQVIPGAGDVTADSAGNGTLVGTGAAATTDGVIDYGGSVLRSGIEFACGDVIHVMLVSQTTTDSSGNSTTGFNVQVEILHS